MRELIEKFHIIMLNNILITSNKILKGYAKHKKTKRKNRDILMIQFTKNFKKIATLKIVDLTNF